MSAFLVSNNHVNFIVNFARTALRENMLCYYRGLFEEPQKLGATLYEANVRSVDYRYPANASGDSDAYTAENYRFVESEPIPATVENIAKFLKCLDCLDYQSCEFPTWKESESFKTIERLRALAINALPGYDSAPWGID